MPSSDKAKQAEMARSHYLGNKAKVKARAVAWTADRNAKNRKLVLGYLLTHPCVDCGEADVTVLDFDHVRGTKHRNVADMIRNGTSKRRLLAEIDKCDIRCANCHRRRTAKERASYRFVTQAIDPIPANQPSLFG